MLNKYEVDNIIRKTGLEMHGRGFKMPFFADDSKTGYGYAYKYHRTSPFNDIWPMVEKKLHNLGYRNWYQSHPLNTEDRNNIVKARWIGIRSDHPTYNF